MTLVLPEPAVAVVDRDPLDLPGSIPASAIAVQAPYAYYEPTTGRYYGLDRESALRGLARGGFDIVRVIPS